MPVRTSHGTWEALVLPVRAGRGRPRPYAHHARHEGVRQRHSTAETLEPETALLHGGGGGKAVDQGKHVPIARSPDAEPGACVAWSGACASSSEAGEASAIHRPVPPSHAAATVRELLCA